MQRSSNARPQVEVAASLFDPEQSILSRTEIGAGQHPSVPAIRTWPLWYGEVAPALVISPAHTDVEAATKTTATIVPVKLTGISHC